mmetsp:Transcript_32118/g.46798  ORF Transcript_32118/g.46798 Transcript_32118/m.46798 type:complete len:200 (-) Transcript_32118:454-1053(-)
MEGLTVFCTKSLVWGGSTSTNDCHWHIKLPARCGECVTRRTQFCHTIDSEVGIHEFNNWTVTIHTLSKCLTNEVTFIDNFISGTDLSISLLSKLRNVIRRTCLEILSMNGCRRVAKHLLVDCKVDSITNGNISCPGLLLKSLNVRCDCRHLFRADCAGIYFIGKSRWCLQVVVSINSIRVFKLLGKTLWRHRRFIGKFH